jgi:hypothetical protein
MIVSLPDEIISEILSPALHVSDDLLCDTSPASSFATYGKSTSTFLFVCKDWLRVSTPLLYNVVVLHSKAQPKALDTTLKKNPDLGRYIKKLCVEGGFGPSMRGILKNAPNITEISISLLLPLMLPRGWSWVYRESIPNTSFFGTSIRSRTNTLASW